MVVDLDLYRQERYGAEGRLFVTTRKSQSVNIGSEGGHTHSVSRIGRLGWHEGQPASGETLNPKAAK